MRILLIGSGRLAHHLNYWHKLNQKQSHLPDLLQWNRQSGMAQLDELIKSADIIWLAISDGAIADFYTSNILKFKKRTVHFSGALTDSRMYCAHPLMSFPSELLPDSIYLKIQFAVNDLKSFENHMPGFANAKFEINAENKSFYHALCVISGNFPQILWSETEKHFQTLSVPKEALDLYLRQSLENFLNLGPNSLTGPLARKDHMTLELNLKSLSQKKSAFPLSQIYKNFIEVFSK